jgi:hypothetical protein
MLSRQPAVGLQGGQKHWQFASLDLRGSYLPALHGMVLLIGTVGLFDLRMLGLAKGLPGKPFTT